MGNTSLSSDQNMERTMTPSPQKSYAYVEDHKPLPELPLEPMFEYFEYIAPVSFEPSIHLPDSQNELVEEVTNQDTQLDKTIQAVGQLKTFTSYGTSSSLKRETADKPMPDDRTILEALTVSEELEEAWPIFGKEDRTAIENPKTEAELIKF